MYFPSRVYLKPRTMQEKTTKASDRSIPLLLVLSQIAGLSRMFSEEEREMIRNMYLLHLESIFTYVSVGEMGVGNLLVNILSVLEDEQI